MNLLINGNALHIAVANESVNCVITSPPYFGLRSYLPKDSNLKDREIGTEQTPEEYVDAIVGVFREIWRVLKPDGTAWLNIGDSYNGSGGAGGDYNKGGLREGQPRYKGRNIKPLKRKDLILIPSRVALALQADGWWVRNDVVWNKLNPMPGSAKDRLTSSHEYVFLLTKSEKYYFDHVAILEPAKYDGRKQTTYNVGGKYKDGGARASGERWPNKIRGFKTKDQTLEHPQHHGNDIRYSMIGDVPARMKRDVWSVATKPYHGAHYAVFPPDLIEPCVLAGCPPDGIVLDPFAGSGVTCMVARKHGRDAIGLDLNFEYLNTNARERIQYGKYVPVAEGIKQYTLL